MQGSTLPRRDARTLIAALLVAAPIVVFYLLLVRLSFNLPMMDDYHAILAVVNHLRTTPGFASKFFYILGAQHNEYKLWFGSSIAWLQYLALGHLNFRWLSLFGGSFILPLGLVLWTIFLPRCTDLIKRLLLFVPVSCLLFQLSYAETLDWAMASLQNLPVLFFSILAIVLLVRSTRSAFAWSIGCLALAAASSGNGLLVIPIGILALSLQRQYARLLCWLVASCALCAGYAYHFNILSSQTEAHRCIFTTLRHFSVIYTLAMLGNEGTRYGCVVLGLLLCIFNLYLLRSGYFKRSQAVGYCVLFVFLTAVGVGGIRSEFGLAQAITSRYHMYSCLLLSFAWFAIAEFLTSARRPTLNYRLVATVVVLALLFALVRDVGGYRLLSLRERYAFTGLAVYQQSQRDGSTLGPVFWLPEQGEVFAGMNPGARAGLTEAKQLGTYALPAPAKP